MVETAKGLARETRTAPLWLNRLRVGGLATTLIDRLSDIFNADRPIVHVTEYSVAPDFILPSTFAIGEWQGLLLCHVLDGGGQRRLLMYWREREAAAVVGPELARHLQLPTAEWTGASLRAVFPKRRLRPRSIGDAVVWLAAVVGGWAGLSAAWLALFASPEMTYVPPTAAEANVISGAETPIRIALINQSLSVPANVRVVSARLTGAEGRATPNAPGVYQIDPKGRSDLVVTTVAEGSESAKLELEIVARAGRWTPSPSSTTLTIPLKIWPSLERGSFKVVNAHNNRCFIEAPLKLGEAASGVKCQAFMVGQDDVEFVAAIPSADSSWASSRTAPARGKETASIVWTVPTSRAFTETKIQLALSGASIGRIGCPTLAAKVDWECEKTR